MGASAGGNVVATQPAVTPQPTGGPLVAMPSVGGKGGGTSVPPRLEFGVPDAATRYPDAHRPSVAQPISSPNVFQQASQGLTGAMGATAQQMGPRRGGFGAGMGQYYNPFESQVVGNLARDTGRMMNMGANQLGAQATAAKAFGGSRHGIAQGQMMGDAMRNFQNQAGQLRMAGYNQAVANRQAEERNRLNAASQLANMSQQGFSMGRQLSADSMQQGLIQQALNQQLIDAAKGQYAGFTGAPRQAVADMVSAIAGSPSPTNTTAKRDLGLFDYLTAGAMLGGGGLF